MVWAAGIKAPDFIKDIAGLETNRINQLVVKGTLQTTRDDDILLSATWRNAHNQTAHLFHLVRKLRTKWLAKRSATLWRS